MKNLLKNIDALLITNPTNIRYLTGFVGTDPSAREAYVLITKDTMYLLTSGMYREEAMNIVKSQHPDQPIGRKESQWDSSHIVTVQNDESIKFIEISRDIPLSTRIKELIRQEPDTNKNQTLVKLGFEAKDLIVAEYVNLKKKLINIKLVPTNNLIANLRIVKSQDEIEYIKKAAKITDQCFDFIITKIKPGVIESEISWQIETFFRQNNAQNAFSPIVAFGKNTSKPHYNTQESDPSEGPTLLQNNLILLDFGAKVNGYCADMTRMVFIGKPTNKIVNTYNTLLQAQKKALELLAKGERSGAKLDQEARDVLNNNKLPTYPHSLGHAVGLDIHESPRLTIKRDETLKPNMAITIEPGVYYEGEFGMRIEDLVLIKENGIEVLSKTNKELKILE